MKINIKRDYWILIVLAIIILTIANGVLSRYSGYSIKDISRYHCSDNADDDKCICKDDEVKVKADWGYLCISAECEKDADCAEKSSSNVYTCNKPDKSKPLLGYCVCADC